MSGRRPDQAGRGLGRRTVLAASALCSTPLALAGCGCSGSRRAEPAARGGSLDAVPDPGWRVRNPGSPRAIEGYASRASVARGDEFDLYVSTTAAKFRVTAYRMGWYGGARAGRVWRSDRVRGRRQPDPHVDQSTRTVRADWCRTMSVSTDGWPAGSYLLRLDSDAGAQRYVPLTVRSPSADGRVVLVNAASTWQAYNTWGGHSLYQGPDGWYETRALAVSFDRPYAGGGAEKFLVYESGAIALAERIGIPLAYTTSVDLATDPDLLRGARAVISLGHDEYWTPQQRKHVTAARDAGTNVAFLGANACFRRIRLERTGLGNNRLVVCYKTAYREDPIYGHDDRLVTTDYRAQPAPDPESRLTGVLYEGFPVSAPYVVIRPDHWLLDGTGAKTGERFPHLVGAEYDRVTPGSPTPRPIEILAHSPLKLKGVASHSNSAYYTVPGGAGVFATGTMRWVEALDASGPGGRGRPRHGIDGRTGAFTRRVTENMLRAFAAGPAGEAHPAHDNLDKVYTDHEPSRVSVGAPPRRTAQSAEVEAQG